MSLLFTPLTLKGILSNGQSSPARGDESLSPVLDTVNDCGRAAIQGAKQASGGKVGFSVLSEDTLIDMGGQSGNQKLTSELQILDQCVLPTKLNAWYLNRHCGWLHWDIPGRGLCFWNSFIQWDNQEMTSAMETENTLKKFRRPLSLVLQDEKVLWQQKIPIFL